ncbi:MAG: AAA family ATPase [Gammaproteobacteria bacterium]|nr:AAA family ATPase [Gammaproteobacteria bacterium]MCP5441763.1 AAA family ATPase [Chromatiaceae bacterium]MCP5442178.1 AAA family ATPase [Chromatiaceae bacterium]MCP5442352.1 AAA family ATPase [Chromatiaceae bacterium]MCP5442383.1 AAA family ATPase [Chromatiaceae bacterium]
MNKKLLALYGLKWNPFSPELPTEALYVTPRIEHFYWRIEQGLIQEGGFALITGDPGTGKSVVLRLLAERLRQLRDIAVGAITHPSSNLADFYREMGDLFGVELKPHNRWGGFKALRERWLAHLEGTLLRPVLLIDEAQEMHPAVLNELRLLSSTQFDSQILLTVVLAGDVRLSAKLRRDELLPLGSRLRTRLAMEYADRKELLACLKHLLASAGNANLMTPELMQTLCDHAVGNHRVLTSIAAELLASAAQQEITRLDEKLYLEVFGAPASKPRKPV